MTTKLSEKTMENLLKYKEELEKEGILAQYDLQVKEFECLLLNSALRKWMLLLEALWGQDCKMRLGTMNVRIKDKALTFEFVTRLGSPTEEQLKLVEADPYSWEKFLEETQCL